MAKKQTLKSLLGASDGRVQASLRLDPVSISPTITRVAGSTPATVQAVQSANSSQLGQLANALQKLNPALQDYHEGGIAQAEFQKEEFRERFAGLTPDERKELINAQQKELENTESEINKRFRGEYGLNPLAKVYAEKYLGASKNTEASTYMANQVEAYKKEIEKLPANQQPSSDEIEARVEGFVEQYNEQAGEEGGQLFDKGSLRYRGLLSATRSKVEYLKGTLPKVLEDHHKDVVVMPALANTIRSIALDSAQDTPDAEGNPLVGNKDINAALKGLDVLDTKDTQKVLKMIVEGFAPEDGQYAEIAIARIAEVAKIGNQPLINDTGFYNELLEIADGKEKAYYQNKSIEDDRAVTAFISENRDTIEDAYFGTTDDDGNVIEGSQEKAEARLDKLLADINSSEELNDDVKAILTAHYQDEQDSLDAKADRAIGRMKVYYSDKDMSDTVLTGDKAVDEYTREAIFNVNKEFPKVTERSNDILVAPFNETAQLDQVVSPEAMSIIIRNRNFFHEGMAELEREALRQGLKGDAARAKYVKDRVLGKNGLKEQFKNNLIKDLTAFQMQKAGIAQAEDDEKTARDKQVEQAAANLAQITEDKLGTFKKKRTGEEGFSVDTRTFMSLDSRQSRTGELITRFYATGDYLALNPDESDEKLVPKAYDRILEYASENLPLLLEDALSLKSANNRYKKKEHQLKDIKQYQDAKAFVGYTTREMIDIIESGDVPDTTVAYDANGVAYAKDYFQKGYKEIKIVDLDENPENVTKLAELLGIKESELKASQDTYRKKYFIK